MQGPDTRAAPERGLSAARCPSRVVEMRQRACELPAEHATVYTHDVFRHSLFQGVEGSEVGDGNTLGRHGLSIFRPACIFNT